MTMRIRRILFAIREPLLVPPGILRKVGSLCRASGARLELFHAADLSGVLGQPIAGRAGRAPVTQEVAIEHIRERLDRIARSAPLKGPRVDICVNFDRPPHEAIVRRVLETRPDLVIASTHTHGLGSRLFLRNTDWELIRHCPCPLLLIKSSRAYESRSVLVAVDPFHAHAKPAKLDRQLLAVGKLLAGLLAARLHVLHAYMPLIAGFQGPLGEPVLWEDPTIEDVHTAQVRREFDRFARQAGIPAARRHLLVGDVPGELRATAVSVKAGIVVMGAVSRSGLSRLFIGSTAERTLDRLACDVLIVKPPGFKVAIPRRPPRRG